MVKWTFVLKQKSIYYDFNFSDRLKLHDGSAGMGTHLAGGSGAEAAHEGHDGAVLDDTVHGFCGLPELGGILRAETHGAGNVGDGPDNLDRKSVV